MFYLRPGNLFKDFWVETKDTAVSSRGRIKSDYRQDDPAHFLAVLAEAKPEEIERFHHLDHPITHTITQSGPPRAKAKDRLVHNGRIFYVQGVDNIGELSLWTIYYAQERSDVYGDKPD
nr:hypothetical protein [uncultured Dysosmobacter sp.]